MATADIDEVLGPADETEEVEGPEYDSHSEVTSEEDALDEQDNVSRESVSSDEDFKDEIEEEVKITSRRGNESEADELDKKGATSSSKKTYDYPTKLNYLFRDARFFLIKSNNQENIDLAMSLGVWSTPPVNDAKLNEAFKEARNVILIFSVKESGHFCGIARLATESRRDTSPVPWKLPEGLSARALGGVFKIDWICKKDLAFSRVSHLYNPWNEGKNVKIGRDGQEIEPHVGAELCRLFEEDSSVDMTPILRKAKEAARRPAVRSRPIYVPPPPNKRGRGSQFRGSSRGRDFGRHTGYGRRNQDGGSIQRNRGGGGFRGRGRHRGGPRYEPQIFEGRVNRQRSTFRPRPTPVTHPKPYAHEIPRDWNYMPMQPVHFTPPPPIFDPMNPPRYYEGPPISNYRMLSNDQMTRSVSSNARDRKYVDNYDRSVDEFLRRTHDRSRHDRRDPNKERERGRGHDRRKTKARDRSSSYSSRSSSSRSRSRDRRRRR
ncbi:YTH domain-containing protein 1-like [Artemia franciscana]|uniref:YTH domain-containing protein n=1 Tax=Artemia franciscana TaxID=6661 RepID=A0AA88I7B3_ARTSF|nr:hypothetical protein QYM36_003796 [Artemia franciscana]